MKSIMEEELEASGLKPSEEAHRIAVISDTHGMLRQEVIEILKTCEAVLHAGDMDTPEILDQLDSICKTYAVRGNVDKDWAENLPAKLELELFGFRIFMVHNKKQIPKDLSAAEIVICGHSHKYKESRDGDVLYLNPGSCGPARFRQPATMMVLTIYPKEHRIETEKIDCTPSASKKEESAKPPKKDMRRLIQKIMKEVDDGKSVAQIAGRNHIEKALAEQICRIYVTHPGVDADGILDRMA